MAKKRKTPSAPFKAKVALAAVKGDRTLRDLSVTFSVHQNQISQWKGKLIELAPTLFEDRRRRKNADPPVNVDELYEIIGRLTTENEWLKKKAAQFD